VFEPASKSGYFHHRMPSPMNPEPLETEKTLEKDLKTFERLPAEIKELNILMDQAEKTIGKESAAIQEVVLEKSEEGS